MSVQHAGGMVSLFHMFILHRLLTWLGAQKGKTKADSLLCNMFRNLLALPPEDVLPVVYLCSYKVAPDHENIITPQVLISYKELSNGGCLITSALEEACGGQTGEK
ncbi:DNA ligase 6-like [Gossypium arboreum]|uniref:DNA ligase 6-like n=1 Tax=Gossypium arboreum TaxID=29729 RepID=UPI0022F19F06|nr:DNA ligase 6-like [Gossypium arboreum]